MHLAYMMGCSRVRAFICVRLPMLGHSFASAMILGVAVSIALYLPTIFAGSGKVNTVTVEAVTLAAGGARGPSASAAMMQMLLPFCVFACAVTGGMALYGSVFNAITPPTIMVSAQTHLQLSCNYAPS